MSKDNTQDDTSSLQVRDLTGKALKLVVVRYGSRLLGLVRTMVIAWVFGASMEFDVFLGTFGAALIFFEVIPLALTQAFVPLYSKYLVNNEERKFNEVSQAFIFTGTLIILLLFVILSIFAEGIVTNIFVFTPAQGEWIELGVLLFRYSLIVFLINFFVGNFSAILYCRGIVIAPSAIFLANNVIIITVVLLLQKKFGVTSVALGFIIGGIFQMAYLGIASVKTGWRSVVPRNIDFGIVRYMWLLFLPAFMGIAVAQLNIVIDRYFTSALKGEGEVTVLHLANTLIAMVTVFTTSLTIAIFPKVSNQISRLEITEMKDLLSRSLRALFFFIFPAMGLVYLLSNPLVTVIYGWGKMSNDLQSITLLLSLFKIFCIWVIFYSLNYQLLLVFFSYRDTVTPALISAFNVFCNVVFNYLFTQVYHFGVEGIVVSTALSVIITTGLLLLLLYRRVGQMFDLKLMKGLLRTLVATLGLAAVILIFNLIIRDEWIYRSRGNMSSDIAYIVAASVFGILAYLISSLTVNRDLTMYFIKNYRSFLSLSNR